jgi:hypothetical protein
MIVYIALLARRVKDIQIGIEEPILMGFFVVVI